MTMPDEKLHLYVLCQTRDAERTWRERGAGLDLEITPVFPVRSGVGTIRSLAAAAGAPFLVCRDEVVLGMGLPGHVRTLIQELNERFPNWALCGNRGIRWDGEHVYDFTYEMEATGLQTAVCPHPVICLDDALLLVNPGALQAHQHLPPAPASQRVGVALSLECLKNGSLMAASPRLMVMRKAVAAEPDDALEKDPEFRRYYRDTFLNHWLHTPDGLLELAGIVDFRHVAEPWTQSAKSDVLDLFDASLEKARRARKPSLTICCRTQFRRPEMLDRAVLSFAVWRQAALALADVRVQIVTDQPPAVAEPELRKLRQRYPGACLGCWHHELRPGRYSRTDLLLAGVERAETDYIWFIDDDDYVNAPAAPALARCLVAGAPVLVVGSSAVIRETWRRAPGAEGTDPAPMEFVGGRPSSSFPAGHIFRSMRGVNYIPVCGMVLPVELVRRRIAGIRALGNYNEDYFLLLLALTAPRVEVSILNLEIASISLRGAENTVARTHSAEWHTSLATFLLEALNNTDGNSPLLWQLANYSKW
jgi:hypothetical protein